MPVRSLKTKNLKYLGMVLVIDAIVVWAILSGHQLNLDAAIGDWQGHLMKNGVVISLATIVVPLLSYLLSSGIKVTLIFWRLKHALPGCRAFSVLVHRDPRIDVAALQKKVGTFPSDPDEQNALWYWLFKKHEGNIAVQESHQRYLFFRDAASISVLMLIVISIGAAFRFPDSATDMPCCCSSASICFS